MEPGGEAVLDLPPPPEEVENPMPPPVTAPAAPEAEAEPVAEPALPVTAEPPVPPRENRVVLRFNGTSWTQIRDASGRSLVMGEMKAGSERVLEGKGPYEMVLGNAGVVEVTVAGRRFDITPYIRGNVARFTLDPMRGGDAR